MNFRFRILYISGLFSFISISLFTDILKIPSLTDDEENPTEITSTTYQETEATKTTESVSRKPSKYIADVAGTDFRQRHIKKILLWPPGNDTDPVNSIKNGRTSLLKYQCKYKNCIFTRNFTYMNIIKFDAIVFNVYDDIKKSLHPIFFQRRNLKQKYIFASLESSSNYPVAYSEFDNFFNWTWTYKLDSDIPWTYFIVHDENNRVVGPASNITWLKYMKTVNRSAIKRIDLKTKNIAWVVSNCYARNKREAYASSLDKELKKYNLKIDMYGFCGNHTLKDLNIIDDYYFYLSFENSMATDYVTEKVMNALEHWAIPVVYGGANYSRFLPPKSYLDATRLIPKKMAKAINSILKNRTKLYEFHKWRSHYSYVENQGKGVCDLCAALNNRKLMDTTSKYPKFRSWWNGFRKQKLFEVFYKLLTSMMNSDKLVEEVKHNNHTRESKLLLHYYSKLLNETIHAAKKREEYDLKNNITTTKNIATFDYNFTSPDIFLRGFKGYLNTTSILDTNFDSSN